MKVQCLIRRQAGSSVTLGDQTYVFNDENDHCCEVDNREHLAAFAQVKSFQLEAPLEQPQPVVLRRKRN